MNIYTISAESILLVVEIVVLIIIFWHTRALYKNSKELHDIIKEVHASHKELHKDSKIIRDSVKRLEKDTKDIVRFCDPKNK